MDHKTEIFSHPYWIKSSERLKYSADVLIINLSRLLNENPNFESDIDNFFKIQSLVETNLLLLGYSMENALKALLIRDYKRHHELPSDCNFDFLVKQIWRSSNGHKLSKLAENAKLTLTKPESKLLEKLEKYVLWNGRYHIPKDEAGITKVTKPGIGDHHSSTDQVIFDQIIGKIKDRLN